MLDRRPKGRAPAGASGTGSSLLANIRPPPLNGALMKSANMMLANSETCEFLCDIGLEGLRGG
jgi:hypothetical protein